MGFQDLAFVWAQVFGLCGFRVFGVCWLLGLGLLYAAGLQGFELAIHAALTRKCHMFGKFQSKNSTRDFLLRLVGTLADVINTVAALYHSPSRA